MELRTDDDTRQARLIYLGPPGYPLPVHLTYAQWGLLAVLAAVFAGGGGLLFGAPGIGFGAGAAILATYLVSQAMNPDRSARQILRTVARDWRRHQPKPDAELPRLSASRIKVGGDR